MTIELVGEIVNRVVHEGLSGRETPGRAVTLDGLQRALAGTSIADVLNLAFAAGALNGWWRDGANCIVAHLRELSLTPEAAVNVQGLNPLMETVDGPTDEPGERRRPRIGRS